MKARGQDRGFLSLGNEQKGHEASAHLSLPDSSANVPGVCGASVLGSLPEFLEQILSNMRRPNASTWAVSSEMGQPPVDLARLTLRRTSWANRSSRRVLTQAAPRREPVVACCLGVCLVFVGLEGRGARQGSCVLVYAAWMGCWQRSWRCRSRAAVILARQTRGQEKRKEKRTSPLAVVLDELTGFAILHLGFMDVEHWPLSHGCDSVGLVPVALLSRM